MERLRSIRRSGCWRGAVPRRLLIGLLFALAFATFPMSAPAAGSFQQFILQTGTPLEETGDTFAFASADWNSDGVPDLVAIKKSNTGTGTTEVHILSGAANYQTWLLHTGTALEQTDGTYAFALADWNRDGRPDLFVIKKSNTGTGTTEVHILSGATNFQTFLVHTGTVLPATGSNWDFKVADWNRDGVPDLFAIKKSDTGTGTTEVHILSGASGFQSYLLETGTALEQTDSSVDFAVADMDGDGVPDLAAIEKSGTDSDSTEVHVLSGADEFKSWSLEESTALPVTDSTFAFDIADWNRDGTPDLLAIKKSNTGTHSTEVHVLSGVASPPVPFHDVAVDTGTPLANVWSGEESLGGVLTSGPAVSSWSAGRLDVFVRGTDNALWHRWFDGSWHGWESLGGVLMSDPAAVSWGNGRIDVFVRGTDDALWHKWWDGSSWSGWESLGGVLTSGPAVASWSAGRLDVFVRGTDNALWHKWWDGSSWSGWESLGGVLTSDPAAVSSESGRIDVFVRGTDNALWHKWYDDVGWSDWESLGGVLTSSPDASSWGQGRVDVFVRGTDNALWRRSLDNDTWSEWGSLGGSLTSDPAAVSWGTGRIDVFDRGTDNALWHKSFPGEQSFDYAAGDWDSDGVPDLFAIKKSNTGTGTTEVHILSGADEFQQPLLQTGTALHETDSTFAFDIADWNQDGRPDLFAIKKSNTGTGTTEVHILSGATNFQSFLLQTGTVLGQTDGTWDFQVADWNRDGVPDLLAIKKSNTGTHSTEVHVLSGATNFQSFLLQTGTPLEETDSSYSFAVRDWNSDGVPDLFAVKKSNTGTGTTEVHVLSGADRFQTWLLRTGTSLSPADATYAFDVADWDTDGVPDLLAIKKTLTDTGTAEVQALSGAATDASSALGQPDPVPAELAAPSTATASASPDATAATSSCTRPDPTTAVMDKYEADDAAWLTSHRSLKYESGLAEKRGQTIRRLKHGFNTRQLVDPGFDVSGAIKKMVEARSRVHRLSIGWADLQPNNSCEWNADAWSRYMAVIQQAHDNGLALIVTPTGSPLWARAPSRRPPPGGTWNPNGHPDDLAAWNDFIRELKNRIPAGYPVAWEIWNEENSRGFWGTRISPSGWKDLYCRARAELGSTAVVGVGGLTAGTSPGAWRPGWFLKRAIGVGLRSCGIDFVGYHPYMFSSYCANYRNPNPNMGTTPAIVRLRALRGVMNEYGLRRKKIWNTEWAFPSKSFKLSTAPNGICAYSERRQATLLVREHNYLARFPFMAYSIWFNIRDAGPANDTQVNPDPNYSVGLVRTDSSNKPGFRRFAGLPQP